MSGEPDPRLLVLERRVAQLEADLAEMRRPESTAATWAAPQVAAWPSVGWAAPDVSGPPSSTAAGQEHPFGAGLADRLDSETALKWGGVGLVVLAVGFAVSTAVSRGWVGPQLQLAGAAVLSAGLVWVGLRLRSKRAGWTHALVFRWHCVGVHHGGIESVPRQRQRCCGVRFDGCCRGGGTGARPSRPVGVDRGHHDRRGLIGWLVIGHSDVPVVATVIWVARSRGSHGLVGDRAAMARGTALADVAAMLVLLGIAREADQSGDRWVLVLAAVALVGCLSRVPSIGDLTALWQQLEVQLAIAAAPFGFAIVVMTFDLERDLSIGLTAFGAAATIAAAAYLVRRWLHQAHFVSLLISASVAFSIGLSVMLSTEAAFVALAVQGAGLVLLAHVLEERPRVFVNAAILEAIAVVFALGAMIEAWDVDRPVGDDVANLLIIAATVTAGWLTRDRTARLVAAAVGLGLVLIWLGSVLVHLPQGQAATSVSWALVGAAVLIGGALRKMREVATTGLGVLGLTVGKLVTVDLHEVDTLWRAALFLVVGLGFLRLGFLLPRLMGTDRRAMKREPTTRERARRGSSTKSNVADSSPLASGAKSTIRLSRTPNTASS